MRSAFRPGVATLFLSLVCSTFTGCASNNSSADAPSAPPPPAPPVAVAPPALVPSKPGFIVTPSDADLAQAVKFGVDSKDSPDRVETAYTCKCAARPTPGDTISISIRTPLYLIAREEAAQAKEYRKVDPAFIAYLRQLKAVRIVVSQQHMIAGIHAVTFQRKPILLRDGDRVEVLHGIPAWKGENPFADKAGAIQTAIMGKVQAASAKVATASMAKMTDDQKLKFVKLLRDEGLTSGQIVDYTGLTPAQVAAMGGGSTAVLATIPLGDDDGVFSEAELAKPGAYEIVFHEPKNGIYGDAANQIEVRTPVSFAGLR